MIWSPGAVLWVAWCLTTSSVFYNFFDKIHKTQILTKTVLFTWSLNMWNCWFKSTMLFRKKNRALPIGIKPISSHCLHIFWHIWKSNHLHIFYLSLLLPCIFKVPRIIFCWRYWKFNIFALPIPNVILQM